MKNKKQKGYALLITMVIISIILLIAIGLSNTTTKQLILSSSAKDSQIAFYQADTAGECALYFDRIVIPKVPEGERPADTFLCGGFNLRLLEYSNASGSYDLLPPVNTIGQCFRINVTKSGDPVQTTITANGYNICDLNNIRTVERTLEISY